MTSAYRLHAAEHALTLGKPSDAVALLREEYRVRPHGPVAALFARALVLTGAPDEAMAILAQTRDRGWRSASLALAEADALFALGRSDEAEDARSRAARLNPIALEDTHSLIWFGHD